jgi:hypothetical protein
MKTQAAIEVMTNLFCVTDSRKAIRIYTNTMHSYETIKWYAIGMGVKP